MKASENRRIALQIATQLPVKKRDAKRVYALLGEIIDGWLYDAEEAAEKNPEPPKPRLVSDRRP